MSGKNPAKRSDIQIGKSRVQIIQKHHQRTGQLTAGTVKEILTNSAVHPRGIKVRIMEGDIVGRIHSFINNDTDMSSGIALATTSTAIESEKPQMLLSDFIEKKMLKNAAPLTKAPAPVDVAVESVEAQIACDVCTFLNSALLSCCEICGSELPH